MADTTFVNEVTKLPVDWANDVNDLVYDVFGGAATKVAAKAALGLGTIVSQNANAVVFTGGSIDGIAIGGDTPSSGVFTTLKSGNNTPVANDVVTKTHLTAVMSVLSAMATMDPSNVGFLGGTADALVITDSSIDDTPVGANVASTGRFTSLAVNIAIPVASGGSGTDAYTGKYLVYSNVGSAHFESVNTIPIADVFGVGTMAVQNFNNVGITGGVLDNVTLGAGTTYSGLGTMSVQNSNNVAITGGTLTNVTLVGATSALGVQVIVGATGIDDTKDLFICDSTLGTFIVDLPEPSTIVKPLYFKNIAGNRVDIRAPVGKLVDAANIYSLFNAYEGVTIISDGANYYSF